jgi:diguanylate cyclase (GGDEF)-like protein
VRLRLELRRWLAGVSVERVEPSVPVFLGVHGFAAGLFGAASPLVLGLYAAVVLAGVAGAMGWRSPAAATVRACGVLGVALTAQLLEPDLVSAMLQWYYCVAAVYALLLAGPAAALIGPAAAGCYLLQWARGVGPAPAESAWLRAGVLVALGWTMYVAGRAYRTERDTARRGRAEAEAAGRELERVANHDVLTGLPNRRGFLARLDAELSGGPASGVALTLLEVDRFAFVNDTFGHDAGDRLLRDVANRLVDSPGATAVGRLAGAEFALLGPSAGVAGLARPQDDVLAALRAPYQIHGQEHHLVLAAGVALPADISGSAEDLLRAAHLALQHAKQDSRDRVVVYEAEMAQAAAGRVALEQRLRRAVRDGDVWVAYQPILDLRTDELHGVEALARWTAPDRTPVPPDVFIPLAEELGLIPELGHAVLAAAMAAMVRWRDAGAPVPSLAVNASPLQLQIPDFTSTVAGMLAAHHLQPDQLTLEITEGAVILAPPTALATLESLRDLGVRISLDDFGTGYSSLARLRDLPVTEVKIDRSFVAELTRDPTTTRLVLALGESLGLHTVAEGVETSEQLRQLRRMGADAAQGYHLARPMNDHEITARPFATVS